MSFLKQHWRFLAALVVLSAILFFGFSEVGARGGQVDTVRKSVQNAMGGHYKKLFDDFNKFDSRPATVQGVELAAQTLAVQKIEKGRVNMLRFELDPRFTLDSLPPDSTLPAQINYYQAKRVQLQRELGFQTNMPSMDTSGSFGFEPKAADKLDKAEVAKYLACLDIVRTVAHSSRNAGVQFVKKFMFPEKIDALANRGLPVRGDGVDANKNPNPPYFDGRVLVVDVRATEAALYAFLIDLQRPVKGELRNRYLAVEGFELTKADMLAPADDLITAQVTLVAYRVNEDAPMPGMGKGNTPQAASGAPRRFR